MWNVIPRTWSFLFILFLFILEGKLSFFGPPLHLNVHVVRPGSVLHIQGFLHSGVARGGPSRARPDQLCSSNYYNRTTSMHTFTVDPYGQIICF